MIYQPPKVKWSMVVQDIIDRGYSVYRIAKVLNVAECTVRNWWKNDGEPGFGNGCVLIDLHKDVCFTATDSSSSEVNIG